MEINIHDKDKYVSVWLTTEESQDETMHDKLTPFCQHWKAKKYRVVIFKSGTKNLAEQTKALLAHALELSAKSEQA